MREETTPAYAVIDCEDDARWSGLAECVVALFGRDDERWTHYRAYDDEFPSDEEFASLKGIVITGSSHRAEFARASAPRWMKLLVARLREAADARREGYVVGQTGVKILAMSFGSYVAAHACGGAVGMLPGSAHLVGSTTLETSEEFRKSAAFVEATRAYGGAMDKSGKVLVVHQNRSQRYERLPEGALTLATSDEGRELEIWTTGDGNILAWQCSFSDSVASVLSHRVDSGLEAKRTTASGGKPTTALADDFPHNDAGFLIGIARAFLRDGKLAPDENESYLRARRIRARDALSWATRRREEILAARTAARQPGAKQITDVEDESAHTRAIAARAFTKIADAVKAEVFLAASELTFLDRANEAAASEYDAIGAALTDLRLFVGSLRQKDETLKSRLEEISSIEAEVENLERTVRAVESKMSNLERRCTKIAGKNPNAKGFVNLLDTAL